MLPFIQLVNAFFQHPIFLLFLSTIGNVWFDYPQVNKVGCFNHHVVHELQALGEHLVDDVDYGSDGDIDDWLIDHDDREIMVVIIVMLFMMIIIVTLVALVVSMYAIPYFNTIDNLMLCYNR